MSGSETRSKPQGVGRFQAAFVFPSGRLLTITSDPRLTTVWVCEHSQQSQKQYSVRLSDLPISSDSEGEGGSKNNRPWLSWRN